MGVHAVHVEVKAWLSRSQFCLRAGASNRTQHGSSHCTPDRKQYRKQQQEPKTDELHSRNWVDTSSRRTRERVRHPKPCHSDKVKGVADGCIRSVRFASDRLP